MKISILVLVLLVPVIVSAQSTTEEIRKPAVAGTFYPADAAKLSQMVNQHLGKAKDPVINGQIIALIVPHAGLIYSGPIAAYAYKLLENSHINKVIMCGPSHRYGFEGLSVYGPGVQWQTPLGNVPCNDGLSKKLLEYDAAFKKLPAAHVQEHCLEVQLPYLQTVLKNFSIVPVIMGRPDPQTIYTLAKGLEKLRVDDSTIMIASTDWQHYKSASEGWPFDSAGMDCLKNLDPDRLEKYLIEDKTEMCGGAPAVAVIKAAMKHGANKIKILKYGNSGDVTGDKSSVVSYVAAVLYKSAASETESSGAKDEGLPSKMTLSESDKARLLEIARKTIESYLKDGSTPEFEVPDNLKQPGAAFVTLNEHDRLRGCIGQTVAVQPLYKTISYCAIQAATSDPRFQPVVSGELKDIHIEISVLTPLQKVTSLDEIQVGRDGLMISKGYYRGLLLPQVATDYGWDRTEFLKQTCHKAGLSGNAYQSPDAEIYKFQAVIFGE